MVHGLALANRGDGRAATRARRTSTPRHSALERLNTQAQPTVLKYDGIASEEVGCSETPDGRIQDNNSYLGGSSLILIRTGKRAAR